MMLVNGENVPLKNLGQPTIRALLEHFQLSREHIAIERNQNILPKKKYDQTVLQESDTIEIIHFVGGG